MCIHLVPEGTRWIPRNQFPNLELEEISLPENSTNPDRLRELTAKREDIDLQLSSLYEQWETLGELAEPAE